MSCYQQKIRHKIIITIIIISIYGILDFCFSFFNFVPSIIFLNSLVWSDNFIFKLISKQRFGFEIWIILEYCKECNTDLYYTFPLFSFQTKTISTFRSCLHWLLPAGNTIKWNLWNLMGNTACVLLHHFL